MWSHIKYNKEDVEEKKCSDCKDIPVISAKEYFESQDTTMGFYSDDELKNSNNIYKFSDKAVGFIASLNMFRYKRYNLIRRIAEIYALNDQYGMSTTREYIISRDSNVESITDEYKIDVSLYYTLAKAILLHISDNFNHLDQYNYTELAKYPDRLFFDWDSYMDAEEYRFYDFRRFDDNLDSVIFKIRHVKFRFDSPNHTQIGIPMYVNLFDESAYSKNIDFNFDTNSIGVIIDRLNTINKIKGSY